MLKRLLLSERLMLTAVAINALVIYAFYFPGLRDVKWLEYVDMAFIVLFVVEAAVKISTYGVARYFARGWNRFDFAIVVLSFPTLLVPFTDIPDTGVFIILRLFRLARLARLVRFVPNMHHILVGLARAMRASVFVLFALGFLLFIFSIVTCHFYRDIVPEHFGDPLISLYSVFKMFTIEGWYEIPKLIAERTDRPWVIGITRLYFGLIVLLGGVFGMSLANAVFVDEMTMDNNEDLEEKIDQLSQQVAELKQLLEDRGDAPSV
ncbi:MAG: ion transporter [Pirellulaceae bacterium]|nr:ion transporter [Pirellulaceae bacterium]